MAQQQEADISDAKNEISDLGTESQDTKQELKLQIVQREGPRVWMSKSCTTTTTSTTKDCQRLQQVQHVSLAFTIHWAVKNRTKEPAEARANS